MGAGLSHRTEWRAVSRLSGKLPAPTAQIQITPLLDVLLVLLIFGAAFAGARTSASPTAPTEPMARVMQDLPLTLPALPALSAAQPPDPGDGQVLIGLGLHGRLFWREQPVTAEILQQQLQQALAERPLRRVVLAADAALPYADWAHWLVWLQARGVTQFSLLNLADPRAVAPASPKIP